MAFNILQYGTPYDWRPIDNSPEFMLFNNSFNREILDSLSFHCIFSQFLLKGEVNDEEETKIVFSYVALREILSGIKQIWESETRLPSSAQIIEDVDGA